ncbi:MAG: FAD-binding oxidoreductase [Myxococcota bacterium]|nr:FAD-binding oxidoreductase [Myxococcota bacterium]
MKDFRSDSFWLSTLDEDLVPRASLKGSEEADVVIVGAGYTGLWTAYSLLEYEPDLKVVLCEAGISGIGASGRNGGWCMGMAEGVEDLLIDPETRKGGLALSRALFECVDEIAHVIQREGIDCHFKKGGTLGIARVEKQKEEGLAHLAQMADWGFSPDDHRWLSKDELNERLKVPGAKGALYSPHVAAVQPARLVRGLARAVESRGARIFETSAVRRIESGHVETAEGRIKTDWVVVATEAYTARVPGYRRRMAPMHSMMVATEPLSADLWEEIGLKERETFGGLERIATYGQRTADDRIAYGSRGIYYYGSRLRDQFSDQDPLFEQVRRSLIDLLPVLQDVKITHRWGGPLGLPRDRIPAVLADHEARLAMAGGYLGEGVGASNLMGRTLADLLMGRETDRVHLPWVGKGFSKWEPEPFRWIGITAARKMMDRLDEQEATGKMPSRLMQSVLDRL